MKTSILVAGLLVGAAILPLQAQAQMNPGMAPMPGAPATTLSPMDKLFAGRAAEGNLAEVMTAQLALKKTKNEGVKMVAQTIIKGHTAAQTDLTNIAPRKGVPIPTQVSPTHMAVMERLQKAKGDDFDKMYISTQLDDHENTIALFNNQIAMGQDADLKEHANKFLPDIVGHTVMIYNVARQIKAPGIEIRPALPPSPPGVVVPHSMAPMPGMR